NADDNPGVAVRIPHTPHDNSPLVDNPGVDDNPVGASDDNPVGAAVTGKRTGRTASGPKDAANRAAASTSRGSRLPPNWTLPDEWRAWTHAEFRVSAHQVQLQADTFRDYWHATPGQKGVKLDWGKTWANWCRRSFAKFHIPWSQQRTASNGDLGRDAY